MILYLNNKTETQTFLNYFIFLKTLNGNIYDQKVIDHTKFRDARNHIEADLQQIGLEDEVQGEE